MHREKDTIYLIGTLPDTWLNAHAGAGLCGRHPAIDRLNGGNKDGRWEPRLGKRVHPRDA